MHGKKMIACRLVTCLLFLSSYCQAQSATLSPNVSIVGFSPGQLTAGSISYLADASGSSDMNMIQRMPFTATYAGFIQKLTKTPSLNLFSGQNLI